jgi:hypothetical protein
MMNLLVRLLMLAVILGAFPARAQSSLRQTPLGFCTLSSMSSATALSSCSMATFTGSGSGTTLTATSVTGLIQIGEVLSGTGITSGTIIVSQLSGPSGGAGTYQTSVASTSSSNSITASGAPTQATYAVICAYTQAINWRDDGVAPTGTVGSGGMGLTAGSCIPYDGTFTAFQAIQQTSGAILGVSFYK